MSADKKSGRGIYERPYIHKICDACGTAFVLRREGSDTCKRCRKRASDARSVRKHKPWLRISEVQKKIDNALYYERHKEEIAVRAAARYQRDRGKNLARMERWRREHGARPAGSVMSGPETMLAERLTAEKIEFTFRKRLLPMGRLEIDFYLPAANLAIELMGEHHRRPIRGADRFARTLELDAQRRVVCADLGIELWEVDVFGSHSHSSSSRTRENLEKVVVRVRTDKMPQDCKL